MLPIQKFINKFGNLEFANDFLREKFGIKIEKEPVFIRKMDSSPSDTFYLYNAVKNVSNVANDAHNLVLNNKMEVVSMGIPHIPELKEEHADLLDWDVAWAEEKVNGISVVAYEYEGNWYLQTPGSPKARNVLPTKNLTYHMAVCYFLMKHFDGDSMDTVLHHFNENYFYHMIYTNRDWIDHTMEALTLVSAIKRDTLEVVDDTTITTLAAGVNLDLPTFSIVSSFDDAVSYLDDVDSDAIIIKDNTFTYKLTEERKE